MGIVRTDISEEHVASNFKVDRICELGTTLAVTSRLNQLVFLHTVVQSASCC
jgi:hypothetical protein